MNDHTQERETLKRICKICGEPLTRSELSICEDCVRDPRD